MPIVNFLEEMVIVQAKIVTFDNDLFAVQTGRDGELFVENC